MEFVGGEHWYDVVTFEQADDIERTKSLVLLR